MADKSEEERSSGWQVLLISISNELTKEDLDGLKYFFTSKYKGTVPIQEINETGTSGVKLFHILERHDLLSETKREDLINALFATKNIALANKLKDFDQSKLRDFPQQQQAVDVPCNITDEMVVKHFKKTELASELERIMSSTNVVVISGLLGSGKSQMAIQYGTLFRKKHVNSLSWKINSKDTTSLLTSLKNLAGNLKVKVEKPEQDNVICLIKSFVQYVKKGMVILPGEHLVVIDDVGEDCEDIIEYVVDNLSGSEPNVRKCIVTTCDKLVLQDRKHMECKGFTETESIDFLGGDRGLTSDNMAPAEKEAYADLAKKMSCLPLGLQAARTYMKKVSIGPVSMAKHLNKRELRKIDKKLKEMSKENDRTRSLFSALQIFIDILKKDLDTDAFEMFQMTQFLDTDDIPVILFDGLCPSEESSEEFDLSLSTNALVEALQRFSFGSIRGIDDERTITTHLAVTLTLQACTPREKKKELYLKLLGVFASLMDKDNREENDYKRIVSLLPHAKHTLSFAEELTGSTTSVDLASNILLAYLYDVVGYTYNFEWISEMEKLHSDMARKSCYKLMDTSEEEIDEEVNKSLVNVDLSSAESLEQFAERKAQLITSKLSCIAAAETNDCVLSNVVKNYVMQKRRSNDDLHWLSKELGKDPTRYKLTEKEFRELCDKKHAMPFAGIKKLFLHELVLQVFYTLGRRLYYIPKDTSLQLKRYFCQYLLVAAEMANHLSEEFPKNKPLYTMLAFRNGKLEMCFEDLAQLGLRSENRLQDTADCYKTLLGEEDSYYVFGVFKMCPKEDAYHKAICYKQLLRCYQTMVEIEVHPKRKEKIKTEGCRLAESLLKKCEEMLGRLPIPGFYIRAAEFYLCLEMLVEAEKLFREVCPKDLLEDRLEIEEKILGKHELNAIYGMKNCLLKTGKNTKAIDMLNRTLRKLPRKQMKDRIIIEGLISDLEE